MCGDPWDCLEFMRQRLFPQTRIQTQTVTTIDASKVIRNPTNITEPSVRYSLIPVKNVFSVVCSVSPVILGASGVDPPFSGSRMIEDESESMATMLNNTKSKMEERKVTRSIGTLYEISREVRTRPSVCFVLEIVPTLIEPTALEHIFVVNPADRDSHSRN